MALGGVNVLEVGGMEAKVSGGERLTVLVALEASLCITWVAVESEGVAGMLSMAVWWAGWIAWESLSCASVRLSST